MSESDFVREWLADVPLPGSPTGGATPPLPAPVASTPVATSAPPPRPPRDAPRPPARGQVNTGRRGSAVGSSSRASSRRANSQRGSSRAGTSEPAPTPAQLSTRRVSFRPGTINRTGRALDVDEKTLWPKDEPVLRQPSRPKYDPSGLGFIDPEEQLSSAIGTDEPEPIPQPPVGRITSKISDLRMLASQRAAAASEVAAAEVGERPNTPPGPPPQFGSAPLGAGPPSSRRLDQNSRGSSRQKAESARGLYGGGSLPGIAGFGV